MKFRAGGILGVRRRISRLSSATCWVSLDVSLGPSRHSFPYLESGDWSKITLSDLFESLLIHSLTPDIYATSPTNQASS